MVTEALRPFRTKVNVHFVSNVDGTHIAETIKKLNGKRRWPKIFGLDVNLLSIVDEIAL